MRAIAPPRTSSARYSSWSRLSLGFLLGFLKPPLLPRFRTDASSTISSSQPGSASQQRGTRILLDTLCELKRVLAAGSIAAEICSGSSKHGHVAHDPGSERSVARTTAGPSRATAAIAVPNFVVEALRVVSRSTEGSSCICMHRR